MNEGVRARPPLLPYVLLVVVWVAGSMLIAADGVADWRMAPPGLAGAIARSATTLSRVAQAVALFYLLGFLAKSIDFLFARLRPRTRSTPSGRTPAVAVLYLTAGDFDATALASLLRLRVSGRALFVVHDDGADPEARKSIEQFVERHPDRDRWEVRVLHRPQRTGGKAGAVNWALDRLEAEWELLLLCDSDSIALDTAAIDAAVGEFDDPGVAVVQFRNAAHVEADEPLFTRRIAQAIEVFDVFATAQARWGYLPFFGHNALVRIASLRALGGLTAGFFSDDLDFSARLTIAGERIVYRRDIAFAERHPADWLAFRKRSRKWAFGCMQVVRARARAVVTKRGIPFPHRIGLLEFMGFYPAQALLLVGLLARHLVLPWVQPSIPGPFDAPVGAFLVIALLAPTFVWSLRAKRFAEWPALAWSCVLVYGGSIPATVQGVWDGLSTRGRPWIPTNLVLNRRAVPAAAWMDGLLGLALVFVPWWERDALLLSPASYLFAATFLLAPLTAAVYREVPPASPAPVLSRGVAGSLTVFLLLAGLGPLALALPAWSASAPHLTRDGSTLLLDGRPFRFRGVHYSPWLPGSGPADPAAYPAPAIVDRDLDRIRDLGANGLLVDGAPRWVVEHAFARGLVTVYSFNLAWNDTSDAAFERQAVRVLAGVDSLRGTPGIVVWLLGHEVPEWVVTALGAPRVEARLRDLAARTRRLDPRALLGHGNWPPTKELDLTTFDLACFNLYPAWPYEVTVRGYGPYLRDVLVPLAGGRPLLVTEFGINSLEAGERRQAEVIASCWSEIEDAPTAGGIVFEWCDEWWKNYDNPRTQGDYWQRVYAPDDAARQDKDPEEYYGLVRADRSPKPALAAVRRMWRHSAGGRSWLPAVVVLALLAGSFLLVRGWRRTTRPERVRAAMIALGAVAATCAGTRLAHADAWSLVDTLRCAPPANAQAGWTVADAGDLDGDGRKEVAVGAHFSAVQGRSGVGTVDLFRGGWTGAVPWAVLEGQQANEHFGEAVAGDADIDGDGLSELAVGAPMRSSGTLSANGAVEVLRGVPGTPPTPWYALTGEASDDWFGQSIALGDLDGDGRAEIAIGAPYNDRAGSAAGAVFIFRGGAVAPTQPWKVLTGAAANDQFGWSVACPGDLDGDGFGDLIVGARLNGTGLSSAAGRVYLFRGGPDPATTPVGSWAGESRDDWFGNSVSAVGDVDHGGRADLLVGAPYNDRGGSAAGAAYLFRGEDPPGSRPLAVFVGESPNAQFGWSVGGRGDVDGDGFADVVVGARMQASGAHPAAGRLYLFRGAATPSTQPWAIASGAADNDWLGNSVGGAFAFLSSARSAAVAGIPYADAGASDAGSAVALGLGPAIAIPLVPDTQAGLRAVPNPATQSTLLFAPSLAPGAHRIRILDLRGRILRELSANGGAVRWDLNDEHGRRVAPGLYLARIVDEISPAAAAIKVVVSR